MKLTLYFSCLFVDEDIDGEEFFNIEMWMLESLVKGLKKLKKFREFWSKETGMVILYVHMSMCHENQSSSAAFKNTVFSSRTKMPFLYINEI